MELNIESLRPLLEEKLESCGVLNLKETVELVYAKFKEEKKAPDRGAIQGEIRRVFEKFEEEVLASLRVAESRAVESLAEQLHAVNFIEDFDSGLLNSDVEFKDRLRVVREKSWQPMTIPDEASLRSVGSRLLSEMTGKLSTFREGLMAISNQARAPLVTLESTTKGLELFVSKQTIQTGMSDAISCEIDRGLSVDPQKKDQFLYLSADGSLLEMNLAGETLWKGDLDLGDWSRNHQACFSPSGEKFAVLGATNRSLTVLGRDKRQLARLAEIGEKEALRMQWVGEQSIMVAFKGGQFAFFEHSEPGVLVKKRGIFTSASLSDVTAILPMRTNKVLLGFGTGSLSLYNYEIGESEKTLEKFHEQAITMLSPESTKEYVAVASLDNFISLFSFKSKTQVWKVKLDDCYPFVFFSPTRDFLIALSQKKRIVSALELTEGKCFASCQFQGVNSQLKTASLAGEDGLIVGDSRGCVFLVHLEKSAHEMVSAKLEEEKKKKNCNVF